MKLNTVGTLTLLLVLPAGSICASSFGQINLTSDIPGLASFTDPNLKDAWGVAFSPTSPIWVSDRDTGVATLYNGVGQPASLVVAVPPGAPNGPTGEVFAGGTPSFGASFIFDTLGATPLGGTIDAWSGGAAAVVKVATPGANYTGLALANNTLYAANFIAGGTVNAFDSTYAPTLAGKFVDPSLPAGYAPFNVQTVNGNLYVEYAKLTPGVPVALPGGGGYVDVFDTSGNLLQRLVSNGPLDGPWGITQAPASFGSFGGDLLIGNFASGTIDAFSLGGTFLGVLTDSHGNPIVNDGLWALDFDSGVAGAIPNALYFTAGPNMGNDGLFGAIVPTPEPSAWSLGAIGMLGLLSLRFRKH